jgi:drug/metabolite transporter (DMT)-like permease
MLFSSFLFAFTGAFAKLLSLYMSYVEVVFFRNIIGVVIISWVVLKNPITQKGGKPFLLFFRGLIGFTALLMYFYNIANISLAEAQTFNKISPIFTAIFTYMFLNEKLSRLAVFGVGVGFVGVLFITGFDISSLSKTDGLGIMSGVLAGLAYTSIRELRTYYDNKIIVLSFMLTGTIGPLILMMCANFLDIGSLDWVFASFVAPPPISWIYIAGLGVFATASQYYMTKAYSMAPGGIIGTISYTNIIFSIVIGVLLGDSWPTIFIYIGIFLVVLSGLFVTISPKSTKSSLV